MRHRARGRTRRKTGRAAAAPHHFPARIDDRQREGEGTAAGRRALDGDVAAEQAREIPRDGKSEPGAAVLPVRAAVGLPERFEDDSELVRRHADPRVADRERYRPGVAGKHPQGHLPLRRELEGVRQQVLENLPEALRVGDDPIGRARVDRRAEREAFVARDRVERRGESATVRASATGSGEISILPASILDRSEDVVDEHEQIVAGRGRWSAQTSPARRTGCRPCCRRAASGENQQRVERRAQLVAHAGQNSLLYWLARSSLRGFSVSTLCDPASSSF